MRYKYRGTEGCLPCGANSLSKSESSSFEGGETAWKAGTLPPELLPLSHTHFSRKNQLCKGDAFPLSTTLDKIVRLV